MAEHGSTTNYRAGCRCEWCIAANTQTAADRRAFWQAPENYNPELDWHGTPRGYSYYGCRCGDCKAAQRQYRKEREWVQFWR